MADRDAALTAEQSAEYVVVVGASAGGLEALRTLLSAVRIGCQGAIVVVAPGLARGLVRRLEPYVKVPIREAGDATALEPGTVLCVPPAARVAAIDTQLRLAAAPKGSGGRIDSAFRALAAGFAHRAAGVVLTGAGADGTLGLREIRNAAGLTVAQDPDEAKRNAMPRSAIASGLVDFVLPLRDIPAAVERFCGTMPYLPQPDARRSAPSAPDPLDELTDLVERRTGCAFGHLTRSFIARRVAKRMRLRALVDWTQYLDVLRASGGEAEALAASLQECLPPPLSRDPAFKRLERDVAPTLFASKHDAGRVRVWIVGCSTGEDAYLVAAAMLEQRARSDLQPRLQVFASELAEDALQRARLGVYPAEIEADLTRERLEAFFLRDDGTYRVRSTLRDLVVFARHDAVRDFPFSHLDLIVCRRDVLDRLQPKYREAVLRNLHYGLKPEGRLVVDSSAALDDDAARLFVPDGEGGVYRRVGKSRVTSPSVFALPQRQEHDERAAGFAPPALPDARVVHLALLERHSPASVLVDAEGQVIHYSHRAGRYLRLPGGEVTHELLRLLREPLRSAVRAGLDAVVRTEEAWISDALLVHADAGVRRVAVHVEPAGEFPLRDVRLVVFEEVAPGDAMPDDQRVLTAADITLRLESELDEARGRLQTIVGRAQEGGDDAPLLQQGEADLAIALHDLEIAKQELRRINEELVTLDHDNRTRLEELARLSADLEVLLESTGLGTLFLDRELNVVRFTPPLLEIFDIGPADKGRPLAKLAHRLRDEALLVDAKRVVAHSAEIEREVEAVDGRWYLLRMLPYRSAPRGIGGVAITLVDITSRKKAEERLREADRRKDEFIALLAHELRNPLAPITSGIEIMKRRDLDPVLAERITRTMSRQAAQLVRLIDDLLDVSRISSGRLRLRKQRVALRDVLRDAVAAVRPLTERLSHELVVEAPQEPIFLEADAARLTQVVANLLNNSARYTGAGGRIELHARREGDAAVVTVKDNGFGIPEGTLPHIFEMFYQGADPRSTTQAGLGIGLGLAKSLVEMHGGTISAASGGLDKGSAFTVRLPVLPAERIEHAAPQANAKPALGGHRVLVVDDNADAAKTLAVLIETLGENDVHVAFSGEEALPLAQRIQPDTVFLDLKMPEMDGYEVAQRLRQEPWCESAWLVALTGWGLDEHKRRTKDAGFDEHLTKPADPAALEAILSRPAHSRARQGPTH